MTDEFDGLYSTVTVTATRVFHGTDLLFDALLRLRVKRRPPLKI